MLRGHVSWYRWVWSACHHDPHPVLRHSGQQRGDAMRARADPHPLVLVKAIDNQDQALSALAAELCRLV